MALTGNERINFAATTNEENSGSLDINDIKDYIEIDIPEETINLKGQNWVLFGDSFSDEITGEYGAVVRDLLQLGNVESNAVPGNKISQQLTILDNLLSGDPNYFNNYDIVSLLIGLNDFAQNTAIGDRTSAIGSNTFAGYMKDFIETVLTAKPTIKLFVITPTECNGSGILYNATNSAGWTVKQLAVLINQICSDYSIQCIDLYSYAGFNLQTIPTFTYDGLHPNLIGSQIIGDIVARGFLYLNNGQIMPSSDVAYNDMAILYGNSGILGQNASELSWNYTDKNIRITNPTLNTWYGLEFGSSGSILESYIKAKINTAELKISSGRGTGWGGSIRFSADGAEKMIINSNGILINNLAGASTRFVTASVSGQIGVSTATLSGVDNRVVLWGGTETLTNSSSFVYDRINDILGLVGSNKLLFSIGTNANTVNPWFSFNDQTGYINWSWFAKFDGTNWVKTSVLGGGIATKFKNQNGDFVFSVAETDVDLGEVITWKDLFIIEDTGRIKMTSLPTYADDAAAGAGGLSEGHVYKTATGELRIKL